MLSDRDQSADLTFNGHLTHPPLPLWVPKITLQLHLLLASGFKKRRKTLQNDVVVATSTFYTDCYLRPTNEMMLNWKLCRDCRTGLWFWFSV